MIESLTVSHFRGIDNIELHGLKRINVIVGENSSGKTALLESIFLAGGGSPELAMRMQLHRGLLQALQISLDRVSYESLWRTLFCDFDQRQTISIDLLGSPANTRSLTVAYRAEGAATLPFGKPGLDSPFIVPITFQWKDVHGKVYEAQPRITEQGLNLAGAGETMPVNFFSSLLMPNATETASRFSALDTGGKSGRLVTTLQKIFPFIQGISIQVSSGLPMLHATLAPGEVKMPLGLLSSGINKLVSILLGVTSAPQDVTLIDEIENGLYYRLLPDVWSSLLYSCIESDAQIFASTHSEECLQALVRAMGPSCDDFALIRMEKTGNHCSARLLSGAQMLNAIEHNLEIR